MRRRYSQKHPLRLFAHLRMVTHMQDDLIPTSEAARILGTTVSTVNRWVAAGKLVPVLMGPGRTGVRLFDRQAIEDLAVDS